MKLAKSGAMSNEGSKYILEKCSLMDKINDLVARC